MPADLRTHVRGTVTQTTSRLRRHPAVWVLALALALGSVGAALAQALGPAGPTPAAGHASVIAHGVVTASGEESVWRVNTREADQDAEAQEFTNHSFVIADGTPLLLTDDDTGARMRLASGEAALIEAGRNVTIESFGPPESYYLITLAPESEATERTDESIIFSIMPLYGSEPFSLDAGAYDLDLVRDVLAADELSGIAPGTAPTVVLVTSGELLVTSENGESTLAAGEAASFSGQLGFAGQADGTSFVAAYLGAALPSLATPAATPQPATPEATPAASPPATPEPPEEPEIPEEPEETEEPTAEPAAVDETIDTDGDGLTDVREAELGTNPELRDTDDDGINDGNEIEIGSNPFDIDTDDDVLYDRGEQVYGTDIFDPDTDDDGVVDGEEVYIFGTNPTVANTSDGGGNQGGGAVDSDGDGLTDAQEAQFGTDPNDGDSDNDTVNDSNEVAAGTNPNDPESYP